MNIGYDCLTGSVGATLGPVSGGKTRSGPECLKKERGRDTGGSWEEEQDPEQTPPKHKFTLYLQTAAESQSGDNVKEDSFVLLLLKESFPRQRRVPTEHYMVHI